MSSSPVFGILESLTGGEVLMILFFGLVILGPERLPEMAKSIGKWVAQAKIYASKMQDEVRDVLDDPAMQGIKEVGEFVARPRQKLTEYVTAAEREAAETAPEVTPEAAPGPAPETAVDSLPDAAPAVVEPLEQGFVRPDFSGPMESEH